MGHNKSGQRGDSERRGEQGGQCGSESNFESQSFEDQDQDFGSKSDQGLGSMDESCGCGTSSQESSQGSSGRMSQGSGRGSSSGMSEGSEFAGSRSSGQSSSRGSSQKSSRSESSGSSCGSSQGSEQSGQRRGGRGSQKKRGGEEYGDEYADVSANPAEIQAHLAGVDYPCDKEALIMHAQSQDADEIIIAVLERLPDRDYESPTDVSQAVGRVE